MKYKHQPTRKQINDLQIDIKKTRAGRIKGFTIWSNGRWVLDGSVFKDKDEEACRIYTGQRNADLQFEYFETLNYPCGNYLELRSKKKA